MRIIRSSEIAGILGGVGILAVAIGAHAETLDECLLHSVQSASATTTVGELRVLCEQRRDHIESEPVQATEHAAATAAGAEGMVEKRLALERYSRDNPFVLTPHRPNYLLPVVYTEDPNQYLSGHRWQFAAYRSAISIEPESARRGKSDRQQWSSVICLHQPLVLAGL